MAPEYVKAGTVKSAGGKDVEVGWIGRNVVITGEVLAGARKGDLRYVMVPPESRDEFFLLLGRADGAARTWERGQAARSAGTEER